MLISNLKVTNSLRVDFTEFAWAVFWLPSFYFWLNPFSDVPSFSSLGILLDILESTRAAVSIPYLTVQMFRDLNLSLFLREYRHSIKSKTSFMISGAGFILTLTISISNFCKLQSWILKEPSLTRSSLKVKLWSWYAILTTLSWMRFIWLI